MSGTTRIAIVAREKLHKLSLDAGFAPFILGGRRARPDVLG